MLTAKRKYQGLLLDLDGTLADTAPDLAAALNAVRAQHGLKPLSLAEVRPYVSYGARGLIQLGFNSTVEDEDYFELQNELLDYYEHNVCVHTKLFKGFESVLDKLERTGLPWGIVTNKIERFGGPLIAALGLTNKAGCQVYGDSLPHAKPHPAPLHHAAKALNLPESNCLYVGDAERDVQAGKAANMGTLVALYGYLNESDTPAAWQADGQIHKAEEILNWMACNP